MINQMVPNPSPLSQFPIFKSDDIEEAQELIARNFSRHQLKIVSNKSGLNTCYDGVFLNGVGLLYNHCGAELAITPQSDRYFFTQTTLTGHTTVGLGRQETSTGPGDTIVVSPGTDYQFRLFEHCSRMLVMFEKEVLEDSLRQLLNRELKEPLVFDLPMSQGGKHQAAWNRAIAHLCEQFQNSKQLLGYDAFVRNSLDMMKSLLLHTQTHNYSELLHDTTQNSSPRHVRRAISYIEEHIDQALSLGEVAAAVGVSARTLQKGFLRYSDCSPSEYIRHLRTRLIHEQLLQDKSGQSISNILLKYGVSSFGHFSQIYKQKYGCTPSETRKSNS